MLIVSTPSLKNGGRPMKKLTFSFLICLFVISSAYAQSQKNNYKKIDYIQVNQDHQEQFLSLAEQLETSYGALIESGDLLSWSLYKVHYPGGKQSGYSFVSVATAPSLNSFESSFSKVTAPEFIPAGINTEDETQFENICSLVKSELWKVENWISGSDTANGISQYMTMDYMEVAPGKTYDYLMLEDEIAKPIHEARLERDRMEGWEVYSLIIPGGTNYGYNYATGNYFAKLNHIEFGFTDELISQTMGHNSNVPELFDTIYKTRDLVRRELWELVVHKN